MRIRSFPLLSRALASLLFFFVCWYSDRPVFAQPYLLSALSTAPMPCQFCYDLLGMSSKTIHLRPKVFKTALTAYQCARQSGLTDSPILTIIDYSLPSTTKRLWVIDLARKKILFNTLVAHGVHSGLKYAHYFSDIPNSLMTSIGLFVTDAPYQGHYGFALRLKGLEKGFNQHAFSRNIVLHSAWYVSEHFGKVHGYMGRSWGCPTLNDKVIKPVIEAIKQGTLLLAYYPDKDWLAHSQYLHCDLQNSGGVKKQPRASRLSERFTNWMLDGLF